MLISQGFHFSRLRCQYHLQYVHEEGRRLVASVPIPLRLPLVLFVTPCPSENR
jgi:hypothetical protein